MTGRQMGIGEMDPPIHYPGSMHDQAAFGKISFLEADLPAGECCVAEIYREFIIKKAERALN